MSITAINVRNQFRGKVKEVIEGPVVSEIDVETPSGLIVTSVVTTRSVKELGLKPGREVIALVKSTEVSLITERRSSRPKPRDGHRRARSTVWRRCRAAGRGSVRRS